MRQLAGPATEIEGQVPRTEVGKPGRSSAPTGVAVEAEEPVSAVIAVGNLVEHLPNAFRPGLLAHP